MSTATARASQGVFRHSIVALFVAGFISVLVFQNGAVAILHALGYAPPPFRYDLTKPLSVPQIWSGAFWGGIWGIVFGLIEKRFPQDAMYYLACFAFGILPTLVLWFVVFPIKGLPMAAGWDPTRMLIQFVVHGCFGLGIGVLLKWWPEAARAA
ncbi:MAG TPA: hypothetical protein VEK73_21770 [Xanthobacteraceae bacterium]|nr:hypothetical protein [Xanthobacteraceae bacterium]